MFCICIYSFRLYKKLFQKAYGAADGPGMLAALEDSINKYNNDAGMKCADISFVDGEPMMAIATPLMQRVHRTMAQSSELVFVDSTGNNIAIYLKYSKHTNRHNILSLLDSVVSYKMIIFINYKTYISSVMWAKLLTHLLNE